MQLMMTTEKNISQKASEKDLIIILTATTNKYKLISFTKLKTLGLIVEELLHKGKHLNLNSLRTYIYKILLSKRVKDQKSPLQLFNKE